MDGKLTAVEMLDANHPLTLKAQLAEQPSMAWTGNAGIAAEALRDPVTAAGRGAEKVVGQLLSFIPPAL